MADRVVHGERVMLSASVRLPAACATLGLALVLASAGPASALLPTYDGVPKPAPTQPPVDPVAEANSVSVTVRSSGSTSSGRTFTSKTTTVRVAPLCWYGRGMSGQEYYEYWKPGGPARQSPTLDAYAAQGLLHPDFESHATDSAGHWYEATCRIDAPGDVSTAYYLAHPAVWVPPATPAPAAPAAVDPAVLAQIASQSMDLPTGTIEWSPKLSGDRAAVVGQTTWVWVDDAPTSVQVTASIPGLSATVDAHVSAMKLSAPGADPSTCPDTGTPWTAGARASTCTIRFDHSSANQPVSTGQVLPTSTLTARATWSASWVSSLNATPTALPDQFVTTTAQVPVAEIQALTTRS